MPIPGFLISSIGKFLGKGLLILVIIGGAYWYGKSGAEAECREAELQAELSEIKRQKNAADLVLKRTTEETLDRENQINKLRQKVNDYDAFLKHQQKHNDILRCNLSEHDINRLRNIE